MLVVVIAWVASQTIIMPGKLARTSLLIVATCCRAPVILLMSVRINTLLCWLSCGNTVSGAR